MSNLTAAQLQTFKADLNTNPGVATMIANSDWVGVANYYNTVPASPTMLWRPLITVDELNTAIVWSEFTALTVAKQNAYMALIQGAIDATKSNIRNGFTAIFAAGGQTVTNLTAVAKRAGTRFEVLFSAVDGAASTSSVFGALCDQNDVINALAA
jgi:hypothetical protein